MGYCAANHERFLRLLYILNKLLVPPVTILCMIIGLWSSVRDKFGWRTIM